MNNRSKTIDIRYIDDDYRFILKLACVIFNNDKTKVLLLDVNNKGIYLVPGGKIRKLERIGQAVKRELKEEIGLNDIDITFAGISEEEANKANRKKAKFRLKSKINYDKINYIVYIKYKK